MTQFPSWTLLPRVSARRQRQTVKIPAQLSADSAQGHDQEASERTALSSISKLRAAVRSLLECVGEDPDREGLIDTPARFAEAMLFFTRGYHLSVSAVVNNAIFHEESNGMVIERDVDIYSLCEHHLVPFYGKMHVAYFPNGKILGLSKIARIADVFARRLQVQERLTRQVGDSLRDTLDPDGVMVVVQAKHLCMCMRGVEKTASSTVTCYTLGRFDDDASCRNEFLGFVNMAR